MDLLRVYVQRLASSFGSTRCRPALDKALEKDVLADRDALQVALAYAEMERQLGETDRARALFHFAAQIANPRVVGERLTDDFRDAWSSFESKHGTVDTYADMMRILRTTILRFEPGANLKTATMLTGSVEAAIDQIVNPRAGKRARTESHGFVSASASALPPSSAEAGASSVHAATEDPNEIEI
jgi:pre-mRNA-splicing factor SYF1